MFLSLFKVHTIPFLMLFLSLFFALSAYAEVVKLGSWDKDSLVQLMTSVQGMDASDAIVTLSEALKNTPYAEQTLRGGPDEAEELVVNLSEFDCFTFLDVVESLRRSSSYEDFSRHLKNVRYFNGSLTYEERRHFFSDWVSGDTPVEDVTAKLGNGRAVSVQKQLNLKVDGSLWLPGITVTPRQIHYIPTSNLDEVLLSALQPGDYVGVFSPLDGLDVSHTGLIVEVKGQVFLRHASSRVDTGRVVDEGLLQYLQGKPGLVVYRVKP